LAQPPVSRPRLQTSGIGDEKFAPQDSFRTAELQNIKCDLNSIEKLENKNDFQCCCYQKVRMTHIQPITNANKK
jgi:hypothetical protein